MNKDGVKDVIKTPPEYQGLWVAWNNDHSEILASGDDPATVRDEAIRKGEPRPWLDKVPAEDEYYGGAAFLA